MKKLLLFAFIIFNIKVIASGGVRFVVFGDSQFGNPPEFERMVYEASLLAPDFVIQVGDLIHGYTDNKEQLRAEWKRFKGQISLLDAPFYPVPGNHDVLTNEAEEIYKEVWGEEKLYYSFSKGSAHFIVLNSWWGEEDDRIMEWQRNWLKTDLENYSKKYLKEELKSKSIFIFLHSPLWKYPENHDGKKDWDKVKEILKDYPVKLIIGGHTHEHVWEHNDGIDYLILNSAGVRRENIRGGKFSSFLFVTVKDEKNIKAAAIKAGSIYPLDTVNPNDRIEATKRDIEPKTISIDNWNVGTPFSEKVIVEFNNKLNVEQLYRLDWFIPYGSNIQITPESKWLNLEPKQKVTEEFLIESTGLPNMELMPYLEVTTKEKYRTGFLSRDLEDKYKNQKIKIDGYEPTIKLEDEIIHKEKYFLFLPPKVIVNRISSEIIIDGKINEKSWSNGNSIKFGTNENDSTEVRLLYDKNYLYVYVKMNEQNPSSLKYTTGGDIPLTWNDDDIEFFFDTENNQKDYIRLFQNAGGTRFNSLQRWVENKYFESKYESKIEISNDYWAIEMKIPWSDIALDKPPNKGDTWGFNIGRHRQQQMNKESRWSGGSLYDPKRYGKIIFN